MHKRRGRPQAVAAVRASTGLTTHRPTGARVRAWCHGSQDPPAGRDREPVCEPHDSTGEPGAGNRHAGFGERGEETYPWASDCGPGRKRRKRHRRPTGHAPPLDSTPLPQTMTAGRPRRGRMPCRGRRAPSAASALWGPSRGSARPRSPRPTPRGSGWPRRPSGRPPTSAASASQGQRSPRLKVTASKGGTHTGSASFAVAVSTHRPSRSSNASKVWSDGSTSHRCPTPSRA